MTLRKFLAACSVGVGLTLTAAPGASATNLAAGTKLGDVAAASPVTEVQFRGGRGGFGGVRGGGFAGPRMGFAGRGFAGPRMGFAGRGFAGPRVGFARGYRGPAWGAYGGGARWAGSRGGARWAGYRGGARYGYWGGGRRWGYYGGYRYRPGAAFAAGVAGALIGGALAAPYYGYGYDTYGYDTYPVYNEPAYPVYSAPAGRNWCARRFPTYDPTTGLYTQNGRWYRCP